MFHQIKKSLHMLHRQITSTVTLTLLIALLGNTTTGKNIIIIYILTHDSLFNMQFLCIVFHDYIIAISSS